MKTPEPSARPDSGHSPSGFLPAITATLSVRNWAQAVDFYKAGFGAGHHWEIGRPPD